MAPHTLVTLPCRAMAPKNSLSFRKCARDSGLEVEGLLSGSEVELRLEVRRRFQGLQAQGLGKI
eukprot:840084-Rhodomonas_salina.3